jgi:hypothetical protein
MFSAALMPRPTFHIGWSQMFWSTRKRKAVEHPKVSSPLIAEIGPRLLQGLLSTMSPYPSVVCETPAKYHPSANELSWPGLQKKGGPERSLPDMRCEQTANCCDDNENISAVLSVMAIFAHCRNTNNRSARPKRRPACRAAMNAASSSANT